MGAADNIIKRPGRRWSTPWVQTPARRRRGSAGRGTRRRRHPYRRRPIPAKLVEDTARNDRPHRDIPPDYRERGRARRERGRLPRFVLTEMLGNWDIAAERRPWDTGLRAVHVLGNRATVEGGLVALEQALRRATGTRRRRSLRPSRPLTRADHGNGIGVRPG